MSICLSLSHPPSPWDTIRVWFPAQLVYSYRCNEGMKLSYPGMGGECPPKSKKEQSSFEGAAERWCLDAPAPLVTHQDPITDSPSQHTPTLMKLAYPLPTIICISAFLRWSFETGKCLPTGLLTRQQSKDIVPSFHQPLLPRPLAQRHSHSAGTAGLFDKTRSQRRAPVMPLWADVQRSRTKPALRNDGLSALFTCSFFHKIVSHNSNSPTLLATDHLSCRQHTGCLSTKSFSPAAVRAQALRALRDGEYKGQWEKQSHFPEQEGDLNHSVPLVLLGIFSPGKDSCCLFPTVPPVQKSRPCLWLLRYLSTYCEGRVFLKGNRVSESWHK